jgi:hypothetical protein
MVLVKAQKNRGKIIAFEKNILVEMGVLRRLKLADNDKLDKAVYIWFKHKSKVGVAQ